MTIQTCFDIHIEIVEFPFHLEVPFEEGLGGGGGYYFDNNDDDLTTCSSSSSSYSSDDDDDDCGSSCCEAYYQINDVVKRLNGDDDEGYVSSGEEDSIANKLLRRQYMQREMDNDSIGMARRRGIPRWSSAIVDSNDDEQQQEDDRYETLNDTNDNTVNPGDYIYGYEMESYDIPLKGFEDYYDDDEDTSSESSSEEEEDDDDDDDDVDDVVAAVVVQEEEERVHDIRPILLKSSNSNPTLNRLISRTYSSGTLR